MRQALNANGIGNRAIQITEYGLGPGDDWAGGRINYSHEGAAWGPIFAIEAAAGTATGGSILNVRDNLGTNTTGLPRAHR